MDLLTGLAIGLETALSPANILYCFLGTLLGTLIGVLPGVGATATIALLLPITFSLDPATSIIMLAGIYYGAQYGGSTTAILINLPGEATSVVTALDGHKMALQGQAGIALATAALGSFFAGTVATVFIILLASPLTTLALNFGTSEYFSLIVLGLVFSVTLAHGSVIKAFGMVLVGLLFSLVGMDMYTGLERFTLGQMALMNGIDFVAVALGLFGLAEILRNLENEKTREVVVRRVEKLMPSRENMREMFMPIVRGTMLGSILGVLPGGTATLSSFASYTLEKKVSKHPEKFGKGALAGVAGPESANNAAAQTSFIPMLTLGIPSNPIMALMVGALVIHGISPGPNVINQSPSLFWGLIVSMWTANAILLLLNLPLIGLWVRMLRVPYNALIPAIVAFSVVGIYGVNSSAVDLYTVAFFGVFGYVASKLGCEPAPLVLGFILGPLMEEYFRRALALSGGDPTIFVRSPVSALLLLLALLALIAILVPAIRSKREETFEEGD